MFRRLSSSLPKDPIFPRDLEQLGYFVTDNDQIRMIKDPTQKYQYAINKNDRVNDLCKEAMNACTRDIVLKRLQKLGLERLRLPLGASETEPHVPILVSPNLASKNRVIVLLTDRSQDLGIFSYRTTGTESIHKGSAVGLVTAILNGGASVPGGEIPGIILANPGQLLWYRGGSRAVTRAEWGNLPRETALHQDLRIDDVANKIPGNRDYEEHVQYIFDHVIGGIVAKHAKIDVVGLEWTGYATIKYLAMNWQKWSSRISGICLGIPQHDLGDLDSSENGSQAFAEFIAKRCRAYFVSSAPLETLLTGRETFGCNCYSSGEEYYPEAIIVEAGENMLAWFQQIHSNPVFEEIEFVIREDMMQDSEDQATA